MEKKRSARTEIIVLLGTITLLCSGCMPFTGSLRQSLYDNNNPIYELTTENYSGTCKYNVASDTYYTENLLVGGKKRIAAISLKQYSEFSRSFSGIVIKEISGYPNIEMEEVPFNIIFIDHSIDTHQIENKNLLSNGIVVYACKFYSRGPYVYGIIRFKDGRKGACWIFQDDLFRRRAELYLEPVKRSSIFNTFKKLGYIITVPLDILTLPFQLISFPFWLWAMSSM